MTQSFRNGPMGALADLYEKAIHDLNDLLNPLDDHDFTKVINENVEEMFQSIKNIMTHVVNSGYSYANYIRKRYNQNYFIPTIQISNAEETVKQMEQMFRYTLETFEDKWHLSNDEMDHTLIWTSWTHYNMDSLLEHAVMHIHRHRLQIEKMLIKNQNR